MSSEKTIEIKKTRGTCPVCIEMVDARVIEKDGSVFIEKNCPEHGINRGLLSNSPDYYRPLIDFFFKVIPNSHKQRDYILRLTAKCNMECPICLASANDYNEEDLSLESLKTFLAGRKRVKLDLMGAEPTVRDDLEQIIRWANENGHITALHTNGILIGNSEYLGKLVLAGLKEVHLQFDTFDKEHDMIIRGRSMEKEKEKALQSLKKYSMPTDLVVTVLRNLNEEQMVKILDFAAKENFVKEVFYLGCRRLGRATDDFADNAYAPDELIDILEKETGGKISRNSIRIFQKLYFSLLAIFKIRKCFYIHHYMVLRENHRWQPIDKFIDLPYLEPKLDRFAGFFKKSKILSTLYLGTWVIAAILKKGGFSLLSEGFTLTLMLILGFDLSKVKRKSVLLGFITACDPWIYDQDVSANCGKGEISNDQGFNESGADANVGRERTHRSIDSQT